MIILSFLVSNSINVLHIMEDDGIPSDASLSRNSFLKRKIEENMYMGKNTFKFLISLIICAGCIK